MHWSKENVSAEKRFLVFGSRVFIILILIFLFVDSVNADIRINEFLPNPEGDDDATMPNGEWVELYNDGAEEINLEGFVLYDSVDDHELYITPSNVNRDLILQPDNYLVVYRDSDGDFALNNDGDEIKLYNGYPLSTSSLIDEISYIDSNEGYSWSLINDNWEQTIPTPGMNNDQTNETTDDKCDWKVEILLDKHIFDSSEDVNWAVKVSRNDGKKTDVSVRGYVKDILTGWQMDYKPWTNESITDYRNQKYNPNLEENKFYLIFFNITELNCDDTNLENNYEEKLIAVLKPDNSEIQNYTKIKINEFLPDPEGYDNAPMPDGEWVELYNSGDIALDLENLSLKDNTGEDIDIFISDTNTIDGTVINAHGYLIVYMNGRSGFLNNDGFEKISLYRDDNLIDEVSYSGSKEGVSWSLIDDGWRMSVPSLGSTNNDDRPNKSVLKIEEVYDLGSNKVAEWGDVLRIKVDIFKGDSTKNVVYLEAKRDNERVSKQTKFNIYEKFSNNTLTMPLQIDANCDHKFKDGRYDIVLSGLDAEIEKKEIEIRGNDLCGNSEQKEKVKIFEYDLIEYPLIVTINDEFDSIVSLKNNDDEDLGVDVWSYVYRGNKKYSGDEQSNLQTIMIPKGEEVNINLKNIVKEAENGEYNFKVKILKDERKTPLEIKKEILLNNKEDKKENIINRITGGVVYESNQIKAKRAGIYFFAFCMSLVLVYYIWRKE